MCKKAVEGLDALCLEVTFGKAALIKTRQDANRLATLMVQQQHPSENKRTVKNNQPIGCGAQLAG